MLVIITYISYQSVKFPQSFSRRRRLVHGLRLGPMQENPPHLPMIDWLISESE